MRMRDFDVITEDVVETDFQRGDTRPFSLSLLHLGRWSLPLNAISRNWSSSDETPSRITPPFVHQRRRIGMQLE